MHLVSQIQTSSLNLRILGLQRFHNRRIQGMRNVDYLATICRLDLSESILKSGYQSRSAKTERIVSAYPSDRSRRRKNKKAAFIRDVCYAP